MSSPEATVDLSTRTVLRLSGGDRQRYLNGQVSNDVSKLTGTNSIAACVTTLKGKLDAFVWITQVDDAYLIDCEAELGGSLHLRLGKYIIADDCELEDVTGEWRLLHRLGPAPGGVAVARSCRRFGADGSDLWLRPGEEPPADTRLLAPAEVESLRIANAVPQWGRELTPDTLPAEARLDEYAIDFHKGCYIGQEVISRIKSVGRVNRRLVALAVRGAAPATPAPGAGVALFDGEKQAGTLTSVAGDRALGFARRDHDSVGTVFTLQPCPPAEKKNLSTSLEIVESRPV